MSSKSVCEICRWKLSQPFSQPFCICSKVVVLAMEDQRFWYTITWSSMVQTLKIPTDAYTSRIEIQAPYGIWTHDLCNTGAALHQLS